MVEENIILKGARIGFRNFAGKGGKYNKEGDKNFCVFLDHELGTKLEDIGWNIRWLNPRSEDDEPTACLQVAVKFDPYPPKVVLISRGGRTVLDSDSIDVLDSAELKDVKLAIRPYNWERDGRHGVKAYLKTGYFTLDEDEFESDYEDEDDLPI